MLIVYRANPGFEGQIQAIDKATLPAEMDAHIAQSEKGKDLAYIEVSEKLLDPQVLVGLTRNPEQYRVVGGVLTKDGATVPLGYNAAEQKAAGAELKNDAVIRRFFTATDAQLTTYLNGITWQQAILQLRRILVRICKAAGLAE